MKKIIIILLAFSAFAFSASAQDINHSQYHHRHHHHHHYHGPMGMRTLNLSQDQIAQIKTYNKNYRDQLQDLNKNENITLKDYRDKICAMKKERKEKFLSLLTEEQKAKLQQFKIDRIQQHELVAAKRLDRMKANLNLTDDQVAKIEVQRKSIHEKIEAVRENENLTREQKMEQLMAIKNENKEGFKKILTPIN
jgi:Spy/CpxP family protein refolding chaperone